MFVAWQHRERFCDRQRQLRLKFSQYSAITLRLPTNAASTPPPYMTVYIMCSVAPVVWVRHDRQTLPAQMRTSTNINEFSRARVVARIAGHKSSAHARNDVGNGSNMRMRKNLNLFAPKLRRANIPFHYIPRPGPDTERARHIFVLRCIFVLFCVGVFVPIYQSEMGIL